MLKEGSLALMPPSLPYSALHQLLAAPPRSSTPGLAWMPYRSTPSARPMPTRGQGELAGRAQVSVSGRSPGQHWDCWGEPRPGSTWGAGRPGGEPRLQAAHLGQLSSHPESSGVQGRPWWAAAAMVSTACSSLRVDLNKGQRWFSFFL